MDTNAFSLAFDIANVSAPIGETGLVNGWIVVGMGMFVVLSCLLLISCIITALPKVLSVINKYIPEDSHGHHGAPAVKTDAVSPVEAIAAAVAVAYHNHHNDGK